MLQFLKTKNFDEVVSDIKISKVVFTCIMLIMAIFAGISCQINQTEQNAAYVKKYLASTMAAPVKLKTFQNLSKALFNLS